MQLLVTDRDKRNTSNSEITVSVIKQIPQEPKIGLKMISANVHQLTFKGCFDYDVSTHNSGQYHTVHGNKHADLSIQYLKYHILYISERKEV